MPEKPPRSPTSEPKVPVPGRVCQNNIKSDIKTRTTIYLDATVHNLARERGLPISQISESALRGILAIDGRLDNLRTSLTSKTAEVIAIQAEIERIEKQQLKALTENERKKAEEEHRARELALAENRKKQEIIVKINELEHGYFVLHSQKNKPLDKFTVKELEAIRDKLQRSKK
jgi:hypothetical protein